MNGIARVPRSGFQVPGSCSRFDAWPQPRTVSLEPLTLNREWNPEHELGTRNPELGTSRITRCAR